MVVNGDRDNTNSPITLKKQRVLLFRTSFHKAFEFLGFRWLIGDLSLPRSLAGGVSASKLGQVG